MIQVLQGFVFISINRPYKTTIKFFALSIPKAVMALLSKQTDTAWAQKLLRKY